MDVIQNVIAPLNDAKVYKMNLMIIAVGVCIGFATKEMIHSILSNVFNSPHIGVIPYLINRIIKTKIGHNKAARDILLLISSIFTGMFIWLVTVILALIVTFIFLKRSIDLVPSARIKNVKQESE